MTKGPYKVPDHMENELRRVLKVMGEAKSQGEAEVFTDLDSLCRRAPSDPVSAGFLGRAMLVCSDTDEDVARALACMGRGRAGGLWMDYVLCGKPRLEEDRPPEYGGFFDPSMYIGREADALEDICAFDSGRTRYRRFRGRDDGFEDELFSYHGFHGYEHSYGRDTELLFKPTGLRIRRSVFDSLDPEDRDESCWVNQGITADEARHVIRLCVESAMADIRRVSE